MVESFRGKPYALQHFARIVAHARRHNPFYRDWIADPDNPPLLDRATALAHNDEILNGHPATGTTSGSIGVPFRYSQSRQWVKFVSRDVERFVELIGGPVSCVRIIPERPHESDPLALTIMAPIDEQIAFIQRHRQESNAVAITTLPTNGDLLAREVIERGIDMSFITRFGTYAETLQQHQKGTIQRAFPNARLWETYSSLEFGMIAMICPYEPDFYHIMAHRLGLEALRDDDTPAQIGEPGRVFVTDYYNRRVPLIRYELGDLVVRGECPCGRIRLPALSQILGRVAGTLLHRNGQRIHFVDMSVALREMPGMRQYQVIQDGVDEYTVTVSAMRNIDSEIRKVFHTHLGYVPQTLRIVYVESIPRSPNGKFRTSICNVQ